MIDKVKKLNPSFGDLQDITGSEEYKNYEQNGITKDNKTHYNKYKGNIKQEEKKRKKKRKKQKKQKKKIKKKRKKMNKKRKKMNKKRKEITKRKTKTV